MNDSLENLYRTHRQGLYSFALSIVGSPQLAEDAIQTVFANLYRTKHGNGHVHEFNGDIVAYVFKSVRNCAIDLCRANKRRAKLSEVLFAEYSHNDENGTPIGSVLTKERDAILRNAIEQLPGNDREAVMLKSFAGLTFEQAGKVLNESPKTIASRYRRALEKLERQLKGKL